MFSKTESQKNTFLEQTKAAREERALEKRRDAAAIKIQTIVRGWVQRRRFCKQVLADLDREVPDDLNQANNDTAVRVYHATSRFLLVWKKDRDRTRFEKLCRYLVASVESDSTKLSYINVSLNKEHALSWIKQIKQVLWICCDYLESLRPEVASDVKSILLFLYTLVAFTSINTWKILQLKSMEALRPGMTQLCANIMGHLIMRGFFLNIKKLLVRGLSRNKIALKHVALSAIMTLATRPLISADFSDKLLSIFLIHIFSVPALLLHLQNISPECITMLENHDMLRKSLELLSSEQDMRIVFNTLEGSYALCLVANLVHLAHIQRETVLKELSYPTFIDVIGSLLRSCSTYVLNKQSNLSHWHPVLGWFSQKIEPALQDSMGYVKTQLFLLWSQPMISTLLGTALAEVKVNKPESKPQSSPSPDTHVSIAAAFLRRAINSQLNRSNLNKAPKFKLGTPECPFTKVAYICSLYHHALNTFSQLRLDILTGLCYQTNVLYDLWKFLETLGPNCGLKGFLDLLANNSKATAPEFATLMLFAECMTHFVTILDDVEMYEKQEPFTLNDYINMSNFLNLFMYKGILHNLLDMKGGTGNGTLFGALHTLLMVLYRRDSRRPYAPQGHWLIKEIKISSFMSDLDKGKKTTLLLLAKMPHIIPHIERVMLFRKYVMNEKAVLGLTESACASPHSTLITVHRNRIVEDGYRQLALLPPQSLKGVIRVRFINEQGLDEAGIDQDGVFKEFLEETIKRVFDPGLNLFRCTEEEHRLYPSPTSDIQENHLQLFEFVGRMLGKAVYEGIVVDVPFASFFLSQLLGQTQEALYSCIDELPSLDKELYRSLTFIKHYQGDVSELELTFSVDHDKMGRLYTYELIPGGKAVQVNNHNKINYIHLMAHFRMHTQIKEQTAAFIRGFRSIINPEWLSLFSTPELQRLISGDNVPLDIADLRRHTQYFGGFHDSHRVVLWLWDILQKDFTEEEKRLFLKFVTSCSQPPLLGFAHLEPPFSIRCVEVGDDEDTGDTIGSVFRGFFTIRKRDPEHRLPTSSTCFNLLKLPNYQKKSTLREKLRYAISSNTGFELS